MPNTNTRKKRQPFFEVYPSNGETRWRYKGANGEKMASGESHGGDRSQRNALQAVRTIKETAQEADIRLLNADGELVTVIDGVTGEATEIMPKKKRLPHQNPRGRSR